MRKSILQVRRVISPPKVLILGDTDVVFRVKLISTYFAFLDYLENIIKFMELSLCGKATAVD